MVGKISEQTLKSPAALTDNVEISEDVGGTPATKRTTLQDILNLGQFTDYMPTKMLPPQDAVAYADIWALVTQGSVEDGVVLPNSGTSYFDFVAICPQELASSPSCKVRIYMYPKATVANSTVNLEISRLYISDTENLDQAMTAETAVDVDLTSTVEYLTVYEYDVTVEATAGEHCKFRLKRTPSATNDDYTDDLLVTEIAVAWQRTPA